MRKTSFVLIGGLVILLLMTAYGGYIFFQERSFSDTLKKNELDLKTLQTQVLKLENEKVLEASAAKQTADKIDQDVVYWSQIIEKIRSTVPEDENKVIADIISYSGNTNRTLNFSVKTVEGRENPYLDVADFIEAFSESEDFIDAFVPSVSSGLNDRGEEILSFSMRLGYKDLASTDNL